ncbi:MAG: hypothetical protein JWO58_923 [Chitinophagaceae bacterium]|nr:hypothetical protein [Chitinophagaceae bacterium]
MKSISYIPLFMLCTLLSITHSSRSQSTNDTLRHDADTQLIKVDLLNLFDYARNRQVPVALYKDDPTILKQKLVIFSHGYGENKSGSYLAYSYLCKFLATHGYLVASVQHELPADDPLAMMGNLQETRMPNWENGLQNILFVWKDLKNKIPNIDEKQLIVIGHSNGGDMSMLFASEYPFKTSKAISLDSRRMPFPLVGPHKIYSLRSTDEVADPGVIPAEKKLQEFQMTIVQLNHTKHIEMTDETASDEQKNEINAYVLNFLLEK